MWLPYNAFKRIADTLQVTCKPHATVTKRVVIWSASSHFVRKDHMTHISNLRQRSTALIFLHLPSSVPPFHAQAWRTAQATRTAFLLKHAKGRMSTCTVTRDGRQQCCQPTCEPSLIHSPREDVLRHSRCSGQSKPKFASTETADIWDPYALRRVNLVT
jgi:hypothetical protein